MLLSPLRRAVTLNAIKRTAPFRNYTTIPNKHEKVLTGYRKYAQQFKNKPGSYMTSFAILHEITAVIPFPFIYLALEASSAKIPFPENMVSEGNRFINKARVYYGYEPLEADSRAMMNLVTTYCIVKALIPVRIAASAAMTPYFAERLIGPMVAFVRKRL